MAKRIIIALVVGGVIILAALYYASFMRRPVVTQSASEAVSQPREAPSPADSEWKVRDLTGRSYIAYRDSIAKPYPTRADLALLFSAPLRVEHAIRGDFDRDGKKEIAVGLQFPTPWELVGPFSRYVLLAIVKKHRNVWRPIWNTHFLEGSFGFPEQALTALDINHDGTLEILLYRWVGGSCGYNLHVFQHKKQGYRQVLQTRWSKDIYFRDLDGDGRKEVVSEYSFPTSASDLSVIYRWQGRAYAIANPKRYPAFWRRQATIYWEGAQELLRKNDPQLDSSIVRDLLTAADCFRLGNRPKQAKKALAIINSSKRLREEAKKLKEDL